MNINDKIAAELQVRPAQVASAVQLLDEGATVPFIARYRKEATGSLDDGQLRQLAARLDYLRSLEERRTVILQSIASQNQLSPELEALIQAAEDKTRLEDLYLPYKPKRRSRATVAREQGLEPLADALAADPSTPPESLALPFVRGEVADVKAALDGARAIWLERFGEDAELLAQLRPRFWGEARLSARVLEGQETAGQKFQDYFAHEEALHAVPSHRALALLRGRNEGILGLTLTVEDGDYERLLSDHYQFNTGASAWLAQTVRLGWRAKLLPSAELEALQRLKEEADRAAIAVFAANLKDLLLAAPAGHRPTLGLDPGFRTGIKTAVVDGTGKLVATAVVYLHREEEALRTLAELVRRHDVQLVAIGNGTASRETNALAAQLCARCPGLSKITVSEAGASVYSASELAAREFPELDVSLRGAVSIARRLQDPLAELVKIEPKAIGVGQYQHDVNQNQLAAALDAVVEDCVNGVGVDVNTASAQLLQRISGLSITLAHSIVRHRDEHGAFPDRQALLQVPRLGPKTFEQAAGFLRISGGREPLDNSAVHPESYAVARAMIASLDLAPPAVIGNGAALRRLRLGDFIRPDCGLPTLQAIVRELEKAGRDPRGEYQGARFAEGVNELKDLRVGMVLEGVISNVASFGAFVDIGVHQDGLIHISQMAKRFVSDPRELVKAGEVVRVRVLEVDEERQRVALALVREARDEAEDHGRRDRRPAKTKADKPRITALAAELSVLKKNQ